jgi:hypothetical protein
MGTPLRWAFDQGWIMFSGLFDRAGMRGYTEPFSIPQDPDVGSSPLYIKGCSLISTLYFEPDRNDGGFPVEMNLPFTFVNLRDLGGIVT